MCTLYNKTMLSFHSQLRFIYISNFCSFFFFSCVLVLLDRFAIIKFNMVLLLTSSGYEMATIQLRFKITFEFHFNFVLSFLFSSLFLRMIKETISIFNCFYFINTVHLHDFQLEHSHIHRFQYQLLLLWSFCVE